MVSIINSQKGKYPIQDFTFLDEMKEITWGDVLKKGCLSTALAFGSGRFCHTPNNIAQRLLFASSFIALHSITLSLSQYCYLGMKRNSRMQAFAMLQNVPCEVQEQISFVKNFVQLRRPLLGQSYQNHQLHHAVTDITLAVKDNDKTVLAWKEVLDALNGMRVYYPDKIKHTLNFSETSFEQQRLNGLVQYKIKTEVLDPEHPEFIRDLKEIADIDQDCFGNLQDSFGYGIDLSLNKTLLPVASLLKKWGKLAQFNQVKPLFNFIVARDESSNKILGFLGYVPKEQSIDICGIGRDPGAVRMGVGSLLLDRLIDHIPGTYEIKLEVRESNQDAIALYLKKGFKFIASEVDHCAFPNETCLNMTRPSTGPSNLLSHT